MAFVVVYDTCALYGNTARNLLIRVAQARLVQAKWTGQILDELNRALTNLRSAKLTGAYLRHSEISAIGTTFTGADLRGADLTNAVHDATTVIKDVQTRHRLRPPPAPPP